MSDASATVLFAGGGTGGHIYPNVAITERLRDRCRAQVHFLVSNRPGDERIMASIGHRFAVSPARPLPSLKQPTEMWRFGWRFQQAVREVLALIDREQVRAVVATGGFVSGPAMVAAWRARLPRVLVNLDAVPGQANRQLSHIATHVFSVYRTPILPQAERIGLPLRRICLGDGSIEQARIDLGLQPDRPTLFITGATHGAESIIRMMIAATEHPDTAAQLKDWQVYHQCGTFDPAELQRAYDRAGLTAKVVDYCQTMGKAYRAATLVLSRSGAGSVAEAWANGVPTLFMPNPYHKDQHQRHNAKSMAEAGAAVIVDDRIDAPHNLELVMPHLVRLIQDDAHREAMRAAAAASRPSDGAAVVAEWLDWRLS